VPTGHLIATATKLGISVRAVADRLTELGYTHTADPTALLDTALSYRDTTLLSRDFDSIAPWLDRQHPVPTRHLISAATVLDISVRAVADRLTELGYTLAADPATLPNSALTHNDTILISENLNSGAPWLDLSQPVGPVHVIVAAMKTGQSVRAVVDRLVSLGFSEVRLTLDRGRPGDG